MSDDIKKFVSDFAEYMETEQVKCLNACTAAGIRHPKALGDLMAHLTPQERPFECLDEWTEWTKKAYQLAARVRGQEGDA